MPIIRKYKPLLYTTTMRNPQRLKYMLYVLQKFEGQILDNRLATIICGETIRFGLYRPMKQIPSVKQKWETTQKGEFSDYMLTDDEVQKMLNFNPQSHKEAGFDKGWPSRFATIYDLMKELGLAYFWIGEPIIISELGKHLLKAIEVTIDKDDNFVSHDIVNPEYEQQVFLQALAKSQRKNPFVRVLNDNIPLILLIQVIQKINNDPTQNGCGISRRELPLLLFWKDNNAGSLYRRIVELRKNYNYTPSDEVIIDVCINEIMGGNFKKIKLKSIVDEYPDEFIRKMRMTGLFSLRGAGRFLDINKDASDKVEYILNNYSNYELFTDERTYFEYMADLDENLIKIHHPQIAKNNSETLLDAWLSLYSWSKIKKELEVLAKKKNSKDNVLKLIAAPSRLEFLTALAIKSKMPNVRVVPNYSCDDTGLPTSTAGGNKGDIECFEKKYGVLVEVTMATGRTQTMMEIWPIERHLTDFQNSFQGKIQQAQCIFVAPSIYADSQRQIQFVKADSNGKKWIRPYSIDDMINYLENSVALYDNSLNSIYESSKIVNYVEFQMQQTSDILGITASVVRQFGEFYPLMSTRKWYKIVKQFMDDRNFHYKENEDSSMSIAAQPTNSL